VLPQKKWLQAKITKSKKSRVWNARRDFPQDAGLEKKAPRISKKKLFEERGQISPRNWSGKSRSREISTKNQKSYFFSSFRAQGANLV
jgi:hypothetical protein